MGAVFTGTAAARLLLPARPSVDWQPAAESRNRPPSSRAHVSRTQPGPRVDEVIVRSFQHPGLALRTPIRDLEYAGRRLDVYCGGNAGGFPDGHSNTAGTTSSRGRRPSPMVTATT